MGGAFLADKAYSALYDNPGNANHWVTLELEGVRSNRRRIGARIKVTLETKSGTARRSTAPWAAAAASAARPSARRSASETPSASTSVEIFWPATGQTQAVAGLQLDHRYRMREGAFAATPVELRSFKIGRSAKPSSR